MTSEREPWKIVLMEDDASLAELLQIHLRDLGAEVRHFGDGPMGLGHCLSQPFDLLLLDLNLPGLDGIQVCRRLRQSDIRQPILMLTARSEEGDKVLGLETGADDYMTKPFSVRELAARVKALMRRTTGGNGPEPSSSGVIRYSGLTIDTSKRMVTVAGNRTELTPKEYDLLVLLASNPGVTYDRKELLNKVWGYDFEGYEHTVNSHINRLRSKIEADPNHPTYVLTTWGVGYRFNDQPEAS